MNKNENGMHEKPVQKQAPVAGKRKGGKPFAPKRSAKGRKNTSALGKEIRSYQNEERQAEKEMTVEAAEKNAPTHARKKHPAKRGNASFPTKAVKSPKAAPAPLEKKKSSTEGNEAQPQRVSLKRGSAHQKGQKGGKGKRSVGSLKVIPLGGLGEIGKNITAFEYGKDIVVVDCGMGFPDDEMLGIDLVIPDFTYLEKNMDRVRGVLLTHGHEDHIGGVPYLLQKMHVPVYGTGLTVGILRNKLEEYNLPKKPDLRTVKAGDVVSLGAFSVEFIHVNHSIADSCALCIRTPAATVVHSGDFKLDVTPIDGKMMDLVRLGEIGNEGVDLLLCESTNAERDGFTPSERKVGGGFEQIFSSYEDKRLLIATFSSNVHRVQQIIDAAVRHGRKVCVLGRSMVNVVKAAIELGYMEVEDGVLIDASELRRHEPHKVVLVMTGSQGEPMSALYRIAFGAHDKVKITPADVVVLSATAIPGNEKLVGKIVNALVKNGVRVVGDRSISVHVSGHACREELKLMHALIHPRFFMPVHGESRHLYAHKDIAEYMGMDPANIFISEIGKVLQLDENGARIAGEVPAGQVLVDGSGVGDVGSVVLRDRKNLAEDGLVVVVATVDMQSGLLLSGPDVVSRGFVYVREAEDLMEEIRKHAHATLSTVLKKDGCDYAQLKNAVKDDIAKLLMQRTRRRPVILPIIMDL